MDVLDVSDCEKLSPRLDAVMKAHAENTQLAALLEKRIAALMEKHATHVCLYLCAETVN